MLEHFVSKFCSTKETLESFTVLRQMFQLTTQSPAKTDHLFRQLLDLQDHLKAMFMGSQQPSAFNFVVQDIEHLFVHCENILLTHFKNEFGLIRHQEAEDEQMRLDLQDLEVHSSIRDAFYNRHS